MRAVVWGLLVLAPSCPTLAQAQDNSLAVKPQPSAIALADLHGATVHATYNFTGRYRTELLGEFVGGSATRMDIKIGPRGAIQWTTTRNTWADRAGGRVTGQMQRGGSGTIGIPMQMKDGSGPRLWLLKGNTLQMLTVYQKGGSTLVITFRKGDAGLTCSAAAGFAREIGAGPTTDKSPGGGNVYVLSSRPTGTSCQITR